MRRWMLLVLILLTEEWKSQAAAQVLPPQPDSALWQGLLLYFAGNLTEALPLLRSAAVARPDEPDRLNWYAETARRVGEFEAADSAARIALQRLPCSSFAHTVLAGTYNPQYSWWPRTDFDSTWTHLRAAIGCNPDDGNAWVPLYFEALRRGEDTTARRALDRLTATQFLTPVNLIYARWLLSHLPPDAIVVTAGDFDLLSALAVQELERMRPDVTVVSHPLLAMPWYTERLRAQYALALPFPADTLLGGDDLNRGQDPNLLSRRILFYWAELATTGALGRPLALALSTGDPPEDEPGSPSLLGPFWLVVRAGSAPEIDTSAVRAALEVVQPTDWIGPEISEQDRSPVRWAGAVPPGEYVAFAAVSLAWDRLEHGDSVESRKWLDWGQRFATLVSLPPRSRSSLFDDLVTELGSTAEAPR